MKKLFLLFISLSIVSILEAQVYKTVDIDTAGHLSLVLSPNELITITHLTITGRLNAVDFATMRDKMPQLAVLDISNDTIDAYIGIKGTEFNAIGTINSYKYSADTIPVNAFYGKKSLDSVKLPKTAIKIEDECFRGCTNLSFVNIPTSIKNIGPYAFSECQLASIVIPSSVDTIDRYAFSSCKKTTSINIPSSVKFIGQGAFWYCSGLISVESSNERYSSIEGVLFNKLKDTLLYCPISKKGIYTIPSTVKSIDSYAFVQCTALTSITIPTSVTDLGQVGAFAECTGLTTMILPSTINSIHSDAFYGCSNLSSINIPSSINSIGYMAFSNCSNLKSICLSSVIPIPLKTIDKVFEGVDTSVCVLYVPMGTKEAYSNATEWKRFQHIVEIPELAVTDSQITIPGDVESIKTVGISSLTSWTASSNAAWLTVSPDSGFGNSILTISAEANPTNMSRTCIITVKTTSIVGPTESPSIKTITIIQTAGIGTGVAEKNSNESLVFPNPANDYFSITLKDNSVVRLYTITGELVMSTFIKEHDVISTNNLESGLYIVKIIDKDSISTQRLIIDKK